MAGRYRMTKRNHLGLDVTDQPFKIDRFDGIPGNLLAHQPDGAVGDAVEFLEIVQPFLAFFFRQKFDTQAHARHRRSQIMARGCDQPHAAFHGRFEPVESWFSARAVARTSPEPSSGSGASTPSEPDARGGGFQHDQRPIKTDAK